MKANKKPVSPVLAWAARASLGAGALAALLVGLAFANDVWVNTTSSLAPGLYKTIDDPVTEGALVSFCLPQENRARVPEGYKDVRRGSCPDGTAPMAKRLISMNHDPRAMHEYTVMTEGRFGPLQAYSGLSEGCWVFGDHPHSLDSRYFGPVDCKALQTIKPIFAMEEYYYGKF